MSFDIDFDYTNAISYIDGVIDLANTKITDLDTQLDLVGNISSNSFSDLTGTEISRLISNKNAANLNRTIWENLRGKVVGVTNLDSTSKNTLYNFYITSPEPKEAWMSRMPTNIETGLISDANNWINESASLGTDSANILADLVCRKYPIQGQANRLRRIFLE